MHTHRTVARVATELVADPKLSTRTRNLYEQTLLSFLEQHGRSGISEIARQTVEAYLNALTHISFRTHNLHQAVLHRLFGFAVERGYIEANPVSRVRRRKPDQARALQGSRTKSPACGTGQSS